MSSDGIGTLAEPDVATATDGDVGPFAAVIAEGPFGFKPDRNRPIEPHFDGFSSLTPEQARQVLDVRDGRRAHCVLRLPAESVLVEHSGLGYCDPATGRQWGYRVRRVKLGPLTATADATPVLAPALVAGSPAVESPPAPDWDRLAHAVEPAILAAIQGEPAADQAWTATGLPAVADDPFVPTESDLPEPDEAGWTAPARSPRGVTTLVDPAERAALVRVLVLWVVVVLLLVECITVLVSGR